MSTAASTLAPPVRRTVSANYARTGLLLAALTALVVAVAHAAGGLSWAIGALVVMAAMNLASWFWSDRIVLAMHGAQPLPVEAAPQVHRALQRLARRADIPVPAIYYVPDRSPNAFATGRSPERAVVAVTAGLIDLLDDEEIEGVIAHELSHVLNRDVLISTVAATLAGAVSLVARIAGLSLMWGGGSGDRRANPLASLLLIVVSPIIALIVQLAVSRSRELGADATGARLAGAPEGLARALAKLEQTRHAIPMRTADPATAHLYIVEPGSLMRLFATHPSTEERIQRLLELRA